MTTLPHYDAYKLASPYDAPEQVSISRAQDYLDDAVARARHVSRDVIAEIETDGVEEGLPGECFADVTVRIRVPVVSAKDCEYAIGQALAKAGDAAMRDSICPTVPKISKRAKR